MPILLLALIACVGSPANPATPEMLERDLHYLEQNISQINTLKGQMAGAYTRGELLHVMKQLDLEEVLCRERVIHYSQVRPLVADADPKMFPKDIDPRICEDTHGTLYKYETTASE